MDGTVTPSTTGMLGRPSVLRALVIGVVLGVVGWLLTMFFKSVVVANLFCRTPDTFTICSNGGVYAWYAATIIIILISVFALMRANIYRPLLVAVAVAVALWGIGAWFLPMVWWMAMLWNGLLFGLAYALFSWLASHERFVLALIVIIIAIVVSRIVISL